MISVADIKALRDKTGAGVADVKRALEESNGDPAKAEAVLLRKLGGTASKKASRETKAGIVEAYIHANGHIGSMLELFCETDFVARNPAFKELAHDIAMHIAAMDPRYVSLDAVPREVWEEEEAHISAEAAGSGKPAHVKKEIVEGKLRAHFEALALLSQPFIKDQEKSVGELVNEAIGRFGENIKVGRFSRFEL